MPAQTRRHLLHGLAIATAGLPLLAGCRGQPSQANQPAPAPRVGFLLPAPDDTSPGIVAFRQQLQALGYVEGQTVVVEARLTDGRVERLPELAVELVQLPVAVLVAAGPPAIEAARQATSTIPIVSVGGDPVA